MLLKTRSPAARHALLAGHALYCYGFPHVLTLLSIWEVRLAHVTQGKAPRRKFQRTVECTPMRGSLASLRISCLSSSLSLKAAKRSSCRFPKLASITVVNTGKPFLTLREAS